MQDRMVEQKKKNVEGVERQKKWVYNQIWSIMDDFHYIRGKVKGKI